ncbi:hypothetical protein [Ktedonobacter robiniae]|uniref:Antibiotic biosynthesis monooxygenase n=1 Tax=Ktedonobacter robiniae TaxID=2778365 RepID=A0ABQ3V8R2_9CHLR|nr:hypothetical protein [Ktedonobacter robiniae]GHO60775.1 hypothetical protein KSB_92500 [Ktedonobacter robiniae]
MLIRIWHGRITSENLTNYLRHLRIDCTQQYRQARGNRGLQILCRQDGDAQALEVHSFWNTQADLQACIATYDLYQPETQKDLLLEAPYVVLYELLESELDLFG